MISSAFHFQEWAFLAKVDPRAFEARRLKALEQFLEASSERQRALGRSLQREIDAERRLSDDPRQSLATISKMMWQQTHFLYDSLNDFSEYVKSLEREDHSTATLSSGPMPS